ncbi:MAG: hypothetical protein UT84_C0002G0014 [Candidatus Curtissbacteria bacterium GW2011_GWA1_40_16]|uniref:Uncharacterized protein n=1 Tax=Candidatus Curtissbacteria bacterium GW2011_GWA1_40_16 TaxID=1618405 RepID=A0A0G0RFF5_9BACT|nr:MAG: hypothetical protein UT84_C0002G0014 [Candidatus Curtissbacteria bacterium GW2011_GWA1_40_16]
MDREREKYLPDGIELDEDLAILSFAAREGISFDKVFEGLHFKMDPIYDFDDYFDNAVDRNYYAFVTLFNEQTPGTDLDLESSKLINGFWQYKNRFLDDPEVQNDARGMATLNEMTVDGLSEFIDFMHAKSVERVFDESELGEPSFGAIKKLVYWSRFSKIADRAIDRLGDAAL